MHLERICLKLKDRLELGKIFHPDSDFIKETKGQAALMRNKHQKKQSHTETFDRNFDFPKERKYRGRSRRRYREEEEEYFEELEDDIFYDFDLKKEIINWITVVVSALLIALFLTNFVIANSRVPSASMENTIMTKDRIIGFRQSYLFSDPKRGDIIIFRYPDDEKIYFVKRIIGIPGDTVDIVDGRVYLNGSPEPLDEPYIKEPMLPEPAMHFEVPENGYFCMGDNRNNSSDARRWNNPFVYRDKIIAKVLFRYFPNIQPLK